MLSEKLLDPCVAEYSVTEPTRREAYGSMCKFLFINIVNTQAWSKQRQTDMARARHKSDPRASVG